MDKASSLGRFTYGYPMRELEKNASGGEKEEEQVSNQEKDGGN